MLLCFQMLFSQIHSQEFELHKTTSFCRMKSNFFQKWFVYFGQKKEEKILVILWAWGFSLSLNFLSVDWPQLTTTYHNTKLTFKSKSAYWALAPVAKTRPYNNFKRRVLVWFRHLLHAFLPPESPVSVIASGIRTAFSWLALTHYITTFHCDTKRADVWIF